MIRIAFAGTGNIARVHARDLAGPVADGTAALVAATDADAGPLATFAAEFGIPATYPSLAELLEREQVDLVHLCTPPGTHHPLALACLRAGASVLVEKPPAISLREFDEIASAEGGPPWFATVFQHRFGLGQRRLKALASQPGGPLGRPLLAICHTTWYRGQAYFDVPWRGRWETEGGGPTMGHGIHQMDMLLDALGDWSQVSAITRTQARRMPTEDLSLAHVTFASGAAASIVNSVLSPREESYLRFDFEHATVELSHLYGYGDDDWRVTAAEDRQDVLSAWKQAWPAAGSQPRGRSGHAAQFRAVLAALAAGQPPPVRPAEARRTLSLVAAIYASALTGHPVTAEDLAPPAPFYAAMNGRQAPP
ncbi:MAG TPA: Gfo/Idh/MocA family oxidoreductase [Trebonia sp.]|nr:Gfo/Idh/MocA family oxidoreductase [Trebonia sp.]